MEATPWVFICSTGQTKEIRNEWSFPQATHNNLVKDLLTAKNFSGNALKNGGLLRIYGRFPPVENLCTTCATPPRSSHIFRLLCTYQSETIPRGLRAAVCGPASPTSRARIYRGKEKRPAWASIPKPEERWKLGPSFHRFCTSVEIVQDFLSLR